MLEHFHYSRTPLGACSGYRGLLNHSAVTQQGVQLGLAASESTEGIGGWPRSTNRENLFQEAAPCGRVQCIACPIIRDPRCFFKCSVSVGRKHLGPFVAVVTGAIAARKQMREIVREAVPRRRQQNGDLDRQSVVY